MSRTPYEEGADAARVPPPDQPACPYPKDSAEYEKWWDGYGDATEDVIRYNGGEDEEEEDWRSEAIHLGI